MGAVIFLEGRFWAPRFLLCAAAWSGLAAVANATGGGDAAAAALASCIAHGKTLEEAAHLAIGAGALACTSPETIHPGMSWENIQYILDKEEL